MKHYEICKTVVSSLTALFLYSCNTSLGHHNMMEEVHSNPHNLSIFDNTILKRERAIELFSTFKAVGSGGMAVVYDSGNGSVLRIKGSSRAIYHDGDNKTLSALRSIKHSNKELPIADIYAIFKIDTDRGYFQPCKVFRSLLDKPHATSNDEDTFSSVLVMQKVELYTDVEDVKREILDFELAYLFLQSHGIQTSDQPKVRNLGYILQDKPVQYTFKINDTLKTYQLVDQRAQEGTNKLYKKTIMIDYDEWMVNCPVNYSNIQTKLDNLVRDGKIEKLY